MGLDQYLYATNYFSDLNHEKTSREKEGKIYKAIKELVDGDKFVPTDLEYGSCLVSIKVAQWRKANQIHKWFVDNVQGGNDNCQDHSVNIEHLEELRDVCKEVLKNPFRAGELLPHSEGFFFGSMEYDQWYFADLEYTVKTLDYVLNNVPDSIGFEYSSSW